MIKKPTPERIEYEEAAKNMRVLDLKCRLSEQGIDTSKVPRKVFDEILRSLEAQNNIYRESQLKIQDIQKEAQNTINLIAKTGETIIESLRAQYREPEVKPVPIEQKENNHAPMSILSQVKNHTTAEGD
jgi:hypothetical protein